MTHPTQPGPVRMISKSGSVAAVGGGIYQTSLDTQSGESFFGRSHDWQIDGPP
jgi:hypothetical protein